MRTGWALRLTATKSADHTLAQDEAWLGTSRLSSNVTFDAGAATASFGLTQKWFWEDNRATLPGSELTATVGAVAGHDTSGAKVVVNVHGREEPAASVGIRRLTSSRQLDLGPLDHRHRDHTNGEPVAETPADDSVAHYDAIHALQTPYPALETRRAPCQQAPGHRRAQRPPEREPKPARFGHAECELGLLRLPPPAAREKRVVQPNLVAWVVARARLDRGPQGPRPRVRAAVEEPRAEHDVMGPVLRAGPVRALRAQEIVPRLLGEPRPGIA